jgi:hypothetical protein
VSIVTCMLPVPVTDAGLKLQLLRLPVGEILHEFAAKLIVPLKPFCPAIASVKGPETSPGALIVSAGTLGGLVEKLKSGGAVTIVARVPDEGT